MYGDCRRRYEAFDPGSVYSRNVVPYYNYTGGGIYWDNIKALQQNVTVKRHKTETGRRNKWFRNVMTGCGNWLDI